MNLIRLPTVKKLKFRRFVAFEDLFIWHLDLWHLAKINVRLNQVFEWKNRKPHNTCIHVAQIENTTVL